MLFFHRNHKANKYVHDTQKQDAYFSVTYYTDIYDGISSVTCMKNGELPDVISVTSKTF